MSRLERENDPQNPNGSSNAANCTQASQPTGKTFPKINISRAHR